MCDVVKNYAKEYAEEEVKLIAQKLFKSGVSFQIVQSSVVLPEKILKEIYEQVSSAQCV